MEAYTFKHLCVLLIWLQVIKLFIYNLVVITTAHTFTIVGSLMPEPKPYLYLDIFKSVAFSNMDFIVGSIMTAPNLAACLASFFAFHHESGRLEKLCIEMESVNRNVLGGKTYLGRGKALFILRIVFS